MVCFRNSDRPVPFVVDDALNVASCLYYTQVRNMSSKQKGDRRACLTCSIIQSSNDFFSRGCPNCEEVAQVSPSSLLDSIS